MSDEQPISQTPVPVRQSQLWALQRARYAEQGPALWQRDEMPDFVTSNAFVARGYAQLIEAFAGRFEGPTCVIELGAASGRLSLMLRRALGSAPALRYIASDFAPATVAALASRQELRDRGVESARIDVLRDDDLLPYVEGDSAVVVVANYVFDALGGDLFQRRDGTLRALHIDLRGGAELAEIDYAFESHPRTPYDDPELESLLHEAASVGPDGVLVFPTGALAACARLQRLFGDRLLILAADLGSASIGDMRLGGPPAICHSGRVALPIDFDLLGRWCRRGGGTALFPPHSPRHLQVAALRCGAPAEPALAAAFEAFAAYGPDDWYEDKVRVDAAGDHPAPEAVLRVVIASGGDPRLLQRWTPQLLALARAGVHDDSRQALIALFAEAARNHLDIGERADVDASLGALHAAFGDPAGAVASLRRSIARRGEHPQTRALLERCLSAC